MAAAGGGHEFAGLLPWSTFEEGRGSLDSGIHQHKTSLEENGWPVQLPLRRAPRFCPGHDERKVLQPCS